jgi:hypothetical protein
MYTYMLLFTSSYWKISIKLWLKHIWEHVILWTCNLTRHSCVFNNISYKVILIITVESNNNFQKISNIFISANSIVRHSLTRKEHGNNNNKICLTDFKFSWIFHTPVTFLSPVLPLPHYNSVSSLVPWHVSMEILIQYVWIFHHHIKK